MAQLFYDPDKTFDENVDEGPFFDNIPELKREGEPRFKFLGFPVYLPFGIGAGPLPTSKHVGAAFKWGYDIVDYKTMRTIAYETNPFPNVIPIDAQGDITVEQADKGLTLRDGYPEDKTKLVKVHLHGQVLRMPRASSPAKTAGRTTKNSSHPRPANPRAPLLVR